MRVIDLMIYDTSDWVCKQCGCDELHSCQTPYGPCHWVAPNLCSACADDIDDSEDEICGQDENSD